MNPTEPEHVVPMCFWGNRFAIYRNEYERSPVPSGIGEPDGVHTAMILNPKLRPPIPEQQATAIKEAGSGRPTSLVLDADVRDVASLRHWAAELGDHPPELIWLTCHAVYPHRVRRQRLPEPSRRPRRGAVPHGRQDRPHDRRLAEDLRNAFERLVGSHPLVILNACGGGQADPIYGQPFIQFFIDRWGARAVVGTDWDVPDRFADAVPAGGCSTSSSASVPAGQARCWKPCTRRPARRLRSATPSRSSTASTATRRRT